MIEPIQTYGLIKLTLIGRDSFMGDGDITLFRHWIVASGPSAKDAAAAALALVEDIPPASLAVDVQKLDAAAKAEPQYYAIAYTVPSDGPIATGAEVAVGGDLAVDPLTSTEETKP